MKTTVTNQIKTNDRILLTTTRSSIVTNELNQVIEICFLKPRVQSGPISKYNSVAARTAMRYSQLFKFRVLPVVKIINNNCPSKNTLEIPLFISQVQFQSLKNRNWHFKDQYPSSSINNLINHSLTFNDIKNILVNSNEVIELSLLSKLDFKLFQK